jgi:hypothetical protein
VAFLRREGYDWAGFWLHFALGAIIGALIGLGLSLTPLSFPLFALSFLTHDATIANVVFSAVVVGCLGGLLRDRLWYAWMNWRRWSR